ncbi:hypothetical protein SAMN04488059_10958 [Devosia psychrophila]|uniref:Uncharacterized protein n=1 Tax=Devosia psychrophila TaxID=728005 RepID=A0A1I1LI55_9HYPH|nr:hypothetical protein SAMN04488059_10958 [Devosia psychrophila]
MMALGNLNPVSQSTPSPLRGGSGRGTFGPNIGSNRHPHLASTVKGEVPSGARDSIWGHTQRTNINSRETSHG